MNKRKILIFIALMGLALNLRSPLTSLPPIIGEFQADLGMNSALTGLLTTIPILCFGLLTPFASKFIAKAGMNAAIAATLFGAAFGTIIRSSGGPGAALAGTMILGAALTIGNIVSLMIIAHDFSHRTNSVTGAYTSALNIGTMFTSAFTAPLAIILGWRMATSLWALLAVFTAVLWGMVFYQARKGKKIVSATENNHAAAAERGINAALTNCEVRPPSPVWKRKIVWLLVIAFASHLFLYYALTAWLPAYFIDTGGMNPTSAGIAASAFQICALAGAFGIPALAASGRFSIITLLAGVGACWLATPIGLLVAPDLWPLWALIGGIAQGGGFTIIFMLMIDQSYDINDNRQISSLVQGLGYSLASLGPIVMGSMHQYFEQWPPGFILLAVIAIIILLVSFVMPRKEGVKVNEMAEESHQG
jgi:CP family cyanate transporter-like MFS transporter